MELVVQVVPEQELKRFIEAKEDLADPNHHGQEGKNGADPWN